MSIYLIFYNLSPTRHHLKAYIVFLIVSLLLVGVLAYLYTPFNIDASKHLGSQTLLAPEEQVSAEVLVLEERHDTSSNSNKRIRLTNLLLRYQKEMSELESSDISTDSKKDTLDSLRQKIENLEIMITELSQ